MRLRESPKRLPYQAGSFLGFLLVPLQFARLSGSLHACGIE